MRWLGRKEGLCEVKIGEAGSPWKEDRERNVVDVTREVIQDCIIKVRGSNH